MIIQDDGNDLELKSGIVAINSDLLRDVKVQLDVRLGQTEITVGDLTALEPGSVVTLERSVADFADLYLNGVTIARGEIVAVGEKFGIRIVEISSER